MLRILTYNVHACVGTDGRHDPERIARVIERSGADVAALQELDAEGRFGLDQPRWLAERLGMTHEFSPARPHQQGQFGNAILSRLPLSELRHGPLPCLPGREPRAVQWATVSQGGHALDVVNTHLGLARRERALQAECLLGGDWLGGERARPLVLCGDLNAFPRSALLARLGRDLCDGFALAPERDGRATFPSTLPLFRLDYVLTSPELRLRSARVERTRLARVASDHLPLALELDWP